MSVQLKMKSFTPSEIAQITGGRLETYNGADGNAPQNALATDSRETGAGVIFCAIAGANVNGNDFIADAVNAGSDCFICQYVPEAAVNSGKPFCAVIVENTIRSIGFLAAFYRTLTKAKFVAITGSVGKTTTKEFVYAVASAAFKTHKTQGNYNNELGMPLTLLSIEPDDEVVVLEMGMSNLGEIEYMTKIAKPDIAIVTNIGSSHLESLGTRENICRAKMEIRLGLPEDGILLLNADEPLLFNQSRIALRREYPTYNPEGKEFRS